MSTYNLELEQNSTWIHCTPGDYTFEQSFYVLEYGDFYASPAFVADRGPCTGQDVLFTVEGAGVIEQGKRHITLECDQAVLVDSNTPLNLACAPDADGWHFLWARLDGTSVARFADQYGVTPLHAVALDPTEAQECFITMEENLEEADVIASETVGLAAHQLLLALLAATPLSTDTFDEAFGRVQDLVEDNYANNVTLDQLADTAQMSKPNLMKAFKRVNGSTPYEYVLRHRINRSKQLLAETNDRVSAIAEAVGFNSESNFSFRFSKIVGLSPRAYRGGSFSNKA